ncbi:MAG TPA: hypothetical protein VF618_10390 [Thermoanaerobaculia bacterium]
MQPLGLSVSSAREEARGLVLAKQGKQFVTVHLQQDPSASIDWNGAVAVDWSGRWYRAVSTTVTKSSTGERYLGFDKMQTRSVEIKLLFEVPRGASLRSITSPHSVVLSNAPPKSA